MTQTRDPSTGQLFNDGAAHVVSSGAIDSDGNYVAGGAAHVALTSDITANPNALTL